jgi:predicted CoA-binding protein
MSAISRSTMQEATRDFLAQKNIAIAGVSHTKNDAANNIYRKLRSEGLSKNLTSLEGISPTSKRYK